MTRAAVEQTVRHLNSDGIAYLPFLIPLDLQVHDDEWHPWALRQAEGRTISRDLPTERMGRIAAAAGANAVDLLPEFRARYQSDLYHRRDPHWTAKGHKLAADVLLPVVADAVSALQGDSDSHY